MTKGLLSVFTMAMAFMAIMAMTVACGGGGGGDGGPPTDPGSPFNVSAPSSVMVGEPVTFTASGCGDRVSWSVGGRSSNGGNESSTFTHTFKSPGTKTVEATCMNSGAKVSVEITVMDDEPWVALNQILTSDGATITSGNRLRVRADYGNPPEDDLVIRLFLYRDGSGRMGSGQPAYATQSSGTVVVDAACGSAGSVDQIQLRMTRLYDSSPAGTLAQTKKINVRGKDFKCSGA